MYHEVPTISPLCLSVLLKLNWNFFLFQVSGGLPRGVEAPREGEGRLEEVDLGREEGSLPRILLSDHRRGKH